MEDKGARETRGRAEAWGSQPGEDSHEHRENGTWDTWVGTGKTQAFEEEKGVRDCSRLETQGKSDERRG